MAAWIFPKVSVSRMLYFCHCPTQTMENATLKRLGMTLLRHRVGNLRFRLMSITCGRKTRAKIVFFCSL